MAVTSSRGRRNLDIWPGFVDALATLLMAIIFLLMIFVVAQFFLTEALSGRDAALNRLQGRLSELSDLLSLEQQRSQELSEDIARLSSELQATLAERHTLGLALEAAEERAREAEGLASALTRSLAQSEAERARAEESAAEQSRRLNRLAADVAALQALKEELEDEIRALAARAEEQGEALVEEREISESARAQIALLNKQLGALRDQLQQLNAALEASEALSAEQKVELESLGRRLNAALATKVQELARYRSEFFGRLRDALGDQAGVRIVGDRFVFQSEVLFPTASAQLEQDGRGDILQVAETLKSVAERIPDDLDWVLQVEGHTDAVPIATERYPSNWELSTARAMSVLRLLSEAGIPPERLSAAGFGEYHPLDPGASAEAYQRNRRIELKLTQR
jgi:chemotaxis protein MotB